MLASRPVEAATVEEVVIAQGCTTTAVAGLSVQIVDETNCLIPGALSEMPARPNLTLGGAVFPYLQTAGRDALVQALDDHPGTSLGVSSMLRTVAQQYLLYRWYLADACGIPLAATPGSSNHEQGTAFDTNQYSTWSGILGAYGWDWYGSEDVYHFTYHGAGTHDLSGTDVLAFQRLWNRNHPDDLIAEDGDYGPQTGGRLSQSPADGFALGAAPCCGDPPAEGACDGASLRRCDGEAVVTRDCAAEGLACLWDEGTQAYTCLDPCGGLGPAGRCDGDTLVSCDGAGVLTRDCAGEGLVCAMDEGISRYACLPGSASPDAGLDGGEVGIDATPDATPDDRAPRGAWGGCGCRAGESAAGEALGLGLLLLLAALWGRARGRRRGRTTRER